MTNDTSKKRGSRPIYDPKKYEARVRELGEEGYTIVGAAKKIGGPSYVTLTRWEKTSPSFAKAFKKIRENSEKYKAWRNGRLLEKTESQLLAALARVREKRANEQKKFNDKFGVQIRIHKYT
jgi:hypothetical protein